jgi:hypothetical protein
MEPHSPYKINWLLLLAGLAASILIPYAIGAGLYVAQGGVFSNFNYSLKIMNDRIMLFMQLGIAANIGLFFLMSKKEIDISLMRGFIIGSFILVIWVFYAEIV